MTIVNKVKVELSVGVGVAEVIMKVISAVA